MINAVKTKLKKYVLLNTIPVQCTVCVLHDQHPFMVAA